MSNLVSSVFDFKHRRGSNRHEADQHLFNLLHPVDAQTRTGPALSISSFKMRLDFVENGVNGYFSENGIALMEPAPLDNGAESLVFDCNNGYVLKIKAGKSFPEHSSKEYINGPVTKGFSPELNTSYSISQKAELGKTTKWQRAAMVFKCLMKGNLLVNPSSYNFGYVMTHVRGKEKKTLKIIDEGAVRPLNNMHEFYRTARWVVRHLPVVKQCLRASQKTASRSAQETHVLKI